MLHVILVNLLSQNMPHNHEIQCCTVEVTQPHIRRELSFFLLEVSGVSQCPLTDRFFTLQTFTSPTQISLAPGVIIPKTAIPLASTPNNERRSGEMDWVSNSLSMLISLQPPNCTKLGHGCRNAHDSWTYCGWICKTGRWAGLTCCSVFSPPNAGGREGGNANCSVCVGLDPRESRLGVGRGGSRSSSSSPPMQNSGQA